MRIEHAPGSQEWECCVLTFAEGELFKEKQWKRKAEIGALPRR